MLPLFLYQAQRLGTSALHRLCVVSLRRGAAAAAARLSAPQPAAPAAGAASPTRHTESQPQPCQPPSRSRPGCAHRLPRHRAERPFPQSPAAGSDGTRRRTRELAKPGARDRERLLRLCQSKPQQWPGQGGSSLLFPDGEKWKDLAAQCRHFSPSILPLPAHCCSHRGQSLMNPPHAGCLHTLLPVINHTISTWQKVLPGKMGVWLTGESSFRLDLALGTSSLPTLLALCCVHMPCGPLPWTPPTLLPCSAVQRSLLPWLASGNGNLSMWVLFLHSLSCPQRTSKSHDFLPFWFLLLLVCLVGFVLEPIPYQRKGIFVCALCCGGQNSTRAGLWGSLASSLLLGQAADSSYAAGEPPEPGLPANTKCAANRIKRSSGRDQARAQQSLPGTVAVLHQAGRRALLCSCNLQPRFEKKRGKLQFRQVTHLYCNHSPSCA